MLTAEFQVRSSKNYRAIVGCLLRYNNRLMTCREVSEKTGIRISTVHQCVNSGRFRHFERVVKADSYPRNFFRLSPLGLKEARKS